MSIDYNTADTTTIKTRLDSLKAVFNSATTSPIYTNAQNGEVKDALVALQSRVNTNPATDLQVSDDSLLLIQQKILEAREDLKIAEDRVRTLRNVDKNSSYYESWFPINRPLRSTSIIVCFIFGIFFFSLSFFLFLRYMGVSFTVDINWLTPTGIQLFTRYVPYGAGIVVLVAIILAIVGWVRKS